MYSNCQRRVNRLRPRYTQTSPKREIQLAGPLKRNMVRPKTQAPQDQNRSIIYVENHLDIVVFTLAAPTAQTSWGRLIWGALITYPTSGEYVAKSGLRMMRCETGATSMG